MADPLTLTGHVRQPDPDSRHRAQIEDLKNELSLLQVEHAELSAKHKRLMVAVNYLREQLDPLHRGLMGIFEKMDLVEYIPTVGQSSPSPSSNSEQSSNPKWESWKQKLSGRPAEMIDLLLLHEEMGVAQLKAAMHCGVDTVYDTAKKLSVAGLLNNPSKGRYRLREI